MSADETATIPQPDERHGGRRRKGHLDFAHWEIRLIHLLVLPGADDVAERDNSDGIATTVASRPTVTSNAPASDAAMRARLRLV